MSVKFTSVFSHNVKSKPKAFFFVDLPSYFDSKYLLYLIKAVLGIFYIIAEESEALSVLMFNMKSVIIVIKLH